MEKETKKINLSSDQLRNLKRPADLECLPLRVDRLLVDQQMGSVALLESNGKQVAYSLSTQEGAMLTFARSGCVKNSHLPTIYHLYYQTMTGLQNTLESITIEAKYGDIYTARIAWKDYKNRFFYSLCTVGDALVFAHIYPTATLQIVKNVLDEMDEVDEWPTDEEITDY